MYESVIGKQGREIEKNASDALITFLRKSDRSRESTPPFGSTASENCKTREKTKSVEIERGGGERRRTCKEKKITWCRRKGPCESNKPL